MTTKTLDINDLVISFGHVYKITDATPDHNNIYDKFSLIEKTSFTNHEYIELCFDIKYDFTGDEILEQSDNYNNTVLTRLYRIKRDFSIFSTPYNGSRQIDAIDATDWNQFNQPYHVIFNNYGGAICNNLATNYELVITSNIGVDIIGNRSSLIASNKTINKNPVSGDDSFHEITGNKADIIINNECNYINNNLGYGAVISNNMCQFIWANNYSEISYNKCNFIAGNRLSGNSRILRNYINGDISGNTDIDSIMDNCNNGSIQQNTSSVGASILSNCNNGSIANSERSSNVSDPIVNK